MPKGNSQEVHELALKRLKVLAAGGREAKPLSYRIIMGDELQADDAADQTHDDLVWAAQIILTGLTGSNGHPLKIPLESVCLIVNAAVKILLQAKESQLLLGLAIQRFVGQFQEVEINPLAECRATDPGSYVVWCDLIVHERSPSIGRDRDLVSFRPEPRAPEPAGTRRRAKPQTGAVTDKPATG